MEKRISELLTGIDAGGVDIEISNRVSANRIKEITMNKIHTHKKRARPLTKLSRIALIAVCLCLVLAVAVLAVGALTGTGEFMPYTGHIWNSPWSLRSTYGVGFEDELLHPVEELGENARKLLTGVNGPMQEFSSLEQAADHFEIKVLENTILADADYYVAYPFFDDEGNIIGTPHCFALAYGENGGGKNAVRIGADYGCESWGEVTLFVSVWQFTENADEAVVRHYANPHFAEALTEVYTSKSGISASIVKTMENDREYYAFFSYGGVIYDIQAYDQGNGKVGPSALDVLKIVLDSFEV